MDYQLVVLKGRSAVKTIRLADGMTTVGRQDGCELPVRSSQVSRKHCQIFEKKGLLLVKDLGSANGTFVNGKRIEEQRVVEPGDVLTVGPIQFRIEKVAAGAPVAAPAGTADLSSGSDAKPEPADTAIPEAVDAPIPLDEDDVLEFVTGGDDEPAPPAKPAKAAAPVASAPKEQASAPAAPAAPAKPKAPPKEEPPQEEAVADEAVAEFLMGIEFDEDDKR